MKAGHLILIVFLAGALAVAGAVTYKRWPGLRNPSKQAAANTANREQFASVPPFTTKEPDRYQAMRIITSVDNSADKAAPTVTRISIARDGDQRRQDFASDTDLQTSVLEIPAGTFVLFPAKKLYADISSAPPGLALLDQHDDKEADFSPERLLHEVAGVARYEKLGSQYLDGRATSKYRVTSAGSTNGTETPTVTLIWIDESLGMPIRSETETSDGNHRSKVTIELRDIRQQVDPNLFELPKGYKKVAYAALWDGPKQALSGGSKESAKP